MMDLSNDDAALGAHAARQWESSLRRARGFVFDIDGTLALADKNLGAYQALPGAVELVTLLQRRGVSCIAFTNGSTKTPAELSRALNEIGLPFDEAHTLTPISVAADHFRARKFDTALVLGVEGVWRPLQEVGIAITVSPERRDDAQVVLIGWYPQFGVPDLEAACRAVWGGAALYASSTAPYVASREGRTPGVSGAIAAGVRNVTGRRATVIGKPSLRALRCASARLGVPTSEMVIVGDDARLEVVMAHRGGALSVAVHTGLGDASSFAALPADGRPHLSLPGLEHLIDLLA